MTKEQIVTTYIPSSKKLEEKGNLLLFAVHENELLNICTLLYHTRHLPLKTVVAADERQENNGFRIYYIFAVPGAQFFVAPYLELKETTTFPSLAYKIHEIAKYEREIQTFFGLTPHNNPESRPLTLHNNWPSTLFPLRKDFPWNERPEIANTPYEFHKVEGEGLYEISVGPVHAGIIEPGHFRFSVVGEEIISLEPRLGYTHKGSEKLFEILPLEKKVQLAERISGDSSFSHSLAFCQALENLANIHISEKAQYLRVIFAEMERISNHLGDIGAIMLDTGFSFGGSQGARLRESIMQWNEKLTQSRFLRNVNVFGGVTKDISPEQAAKFSQFLLELRQDFLDGIQIAKNTSSLLNRLKRTGSLKKDVAKEHGALGVAAKASGLQCDARVDYSYLMYSELPVKMGQERSGDVFARFNVRIDEVLNSIQLIETALGKMPKDGALIAPVNALPKNSATISIVEGWRGDIVYFVQTDSKGEISRVKVRDASFLNWRVVPHAVTNDVVPDFPLINKSFNLSYSGNDL